MIADTGATATPIDWRLLALLADPEIEPRRLAGLESGWMPELVSMARRHGVLRIVKRNLGLADDVHGTDLSGQLSREFDEEHLAEAGLSLLLEHHRKLIFEQFADAGVPAAVVKGPLFARKLYTHQSDRQFTDIDVLIDMGAMDQASRIIKACGFRLSQKHRFDNSARYQEYKWLLDSRQDTLLVELHTNLVHYPALRRRVSFGYAELMQSGGGDPESFVALLMVAVIHASCGHKFHNLKLLVDVLQAARRITPDAVSTLVKVSRDLNAELEALVAISIAGALFDDRSVVDLAASFQTRLAGVLGKRLVKPKMVVDSGSPNGFQSRLRRNAFRWLQISPLARI
jgi:hypothetical protein